MEESEAPNIDGKCVFPRKPKAGNLSDRNNRGYGREAPHFTVLTTENTNMPWQAVRYIYSYGFPLQQGHLLV